MSDVEVKTEVTGRVWKIEANVGDRVEDGDPILIVEAMKMEIPVIAPASGEVTEILAEEGESVTEDQVLAYIRSS